jgi:energy-coupling factor transporter ATP-binding protein EcfA2
VNSSAQLEHWLQLLRLEEKAEEDLYRSQVLETPLKTRKAQGICWYPVVLKQTDLGLGQKLILELERTSELDQHHLFQNGQILAIFSMAFPQEAPLIGLATHVSRNSLKLVMQRDELPDWLDEGKLGLDLCYDETTYREMRRAVEIFKGIQQGPLLSLREKLFGEAPVRFLAFPFQPLPYLNDSQNRAVSQVLQAQELAMIHGPPGTGKTTTLVAAIQAVLQHEKQVLVSAPSNAATDLLCEKLAESGLPVVRLGHPARMSEKILPYTLDEQLSQHPNFQVLQNLRREARDTRSKALRFKRNFGPAERAQRREEMADVKRMLAMAREMENQMLEHILDRARVILCTLVGASQEIMHKRKFETVFIDEAAQALLGGTLIPILKAKRVILAGDHCQLPPTVKSPQALAGGLNKTLFEICAEAQPEAATLLDTQYRMNQQIMGFSSHEFYQDRLLAHASVAEHTLLGSHDPCDEPSHDPRHDLGGDDPWLNRPLEFIDTAGCGHEEELNPESKSTGNPGEAGLLQIHLTQLLVGLQSAGLDLSQLSLGIISPYRQQVNLLKDLLRADPHVLQLGSFSVDTVDGFQGQERDIMYISLVRSNGEGELGFLKDTRRMNVALTRARKKLVVIGDSATLANHRFYHAFQEYCEGLEAWRSGWEFMT